MLALLSIAFLSSFLCWVSVAVSYLPTRPTYQSDIRHLKALSALSRLLMGSKYHVCGDMYTCVSTCRLHRHDHDVIVMLSARLPVGVSALAKPSALELPEWRVVFQAGGRWDLSTHFPLPEQRRMHSSCQSGMWAFKREAAGPCPYHSLAE